MKKKRYNGAICLCFLRVFLISWEKFNYFRFEMGNRLKLEHNYWSEMIRVVFHPFSISKNEKKRKSLENVCSVSHTKRELCRSHAITGQFDNGLLWRKDVQQKWKLFYFLKKTEYAVASCTAISYNKLDITLKKK